MAKWANDDQPAGPGAALLQPPGYRPSHFAADPGLGLRWARPRELADRFAAHSHETLLVGLTRAGVEEYVDGGRPGRSLPGMMRLVPPGVEHQGGALPGIPWSYDVVYVPPAVSAELAGLPGLGLPALRSSLLEDRLLAECADRLFAALAADEPLAVAERLSMVLRRLVSAHAVVGLSPVAAVRHRSLERARDLLHAHASSKIRLDTLAQEAGLSKFHLIRSFRAHTGLTPWQYQARLRIEEARVALRRGVPPARVAQALGFVDQSHFTRTFRALVGTTPGAFAAGA